MLRNVFIDFVPEDETQSITWDLRVIVCVSVICVRLFLGGDYD